MSFVLDSRSYQPVVEQRTTHLCSESRCIYCGQAVGRRNPMAVFEIEEPRLAGVAHPQCGSFDFRYAQFSLSSLMPLNPGDVTLLAHFYFHLFKLPGQGHSQGILRRILAALLIDYPEGFSHIPDILNFYVRENPAEMQPYLGDLETDVYLFLGKVSRDTENQPFNICIDLI